MIEMSVIGATADDICSERVFRLGSAVPRFNSSDQHWKILLRSYHLGEPADGLNNFWPFT
jgi:hypothetical protein